jgi:hypothetical protein
MLTLKPKETDNSFLHVLKCDINTEKALNYMSCSNFRILYLFSREAFSIQPHPHLAENIETTQLVSAGVLHITYFSLIRE